MPLPKFEGYLACIQAIHDEYAAPEKLALLEEYPRQKAKWMQVLTWLKQMQEPEGPAPHYLPNETRWANLMEALNSCFDSDLENTSADQTWELMENNPENKAKWKVHTLAMSLTKQLNMLESRNKLEEAEKAIGKYSGAWSDYAKELNTFGVEYGDYKSISELNTELLERQERKEKLEKYFRDLENAKVPFSEQVKQEKAQLGILKGEYDTLNSQKEEASQAAAAQEEKVRSLMNLKDEIEMQRDQIEENADAQKKKLQQSLDDLTVGLEKLMEAHKDTLAERAVVSDMDNKITATEAFFAKLRKDCESANWFGGKIAGIFSSDRKLNNKLLENKVLFLNSLQDYDKALEREQEVEKTFAGLLDEDPGADTKGRLKIGKFFHEMAPEKRGDMTKYCKDNMALYEDFLRLQKTLGAEAKANNIDTVIVTSAKGGEKRIPLAECLETPLGLFYVAKTLRKVRQRDVDSMKNDWAPGQERMEALCKDAFQEIERQYVGMEAARTVKHNSEVEILEKQRKIEDIQYEIAEMDDEAFRQKQQQKKDSLESMLGPVVKELTTEAQTLEDLKAKEKSAEDKLKEKEAQVNAQQAKVTAKVKEHAQNTEELKIQNEKISFLWKLKQKVMDFQEMHNSLAKQGQELKETLGVSENGAPGYGIYKELTDNIGFGLKRFLDKEGVGKEPGHRNTDEYQGMIRGLTDILKDDCAALKGKKPEEIVSALEAVRAGAENYKHIKESQFFKSRKSMRLNRLSFADELIRFCNSSIQRTNETKAHVDQLLGEYSQVQNIVDSIKPMKELDDVYTDCIAPVVNNKVSDQKNHVYGSEPLETQFNLNKNKKGGPVLGKI